MREGIQWSYVDFVDNQVSISSFRDADGRYGTAYVLTGRTHGVHIIAGLPGPAGGRPRCARAGRVPAD